MRMSHGEVYSRTMRISIERSKAIDMSNHWNGCHVILCIIVMITNCYRRFGEYKFVVMWIPSFRGSTLHDRREMGLGGDTL